MIIDAARKAGFLVYPRNDALADLDAQIGGVHELWELKGVKGKLSKRQQEMRAAGWKIRLIRTVDDVLQARRDLMGRP